MSDITLYAWGRPLSQDPIPVESNLDHTWVTNFLEKVDPTHQPDPKPGWKPPKSYWYCWGSPHDVASHALGSASGVLRTANNISPFNVPPVGDDGKQYNPSSTSGAIVYYGIDGVCHNVANEVLCATGTATAEPLRVQQAKGYSLSTFFFGTYGNNSEAWEAIQKKYLTGIKIAGDDFLPTMQAVVPEKQQAALLALRAEGRKRVAILRDVVVIKDFNYYPELGVILIDTLYKAEKLLGSETFRKLFPSISIEDKRWFMPPVLPLITPETDG